MFYYLNYYNLALPNITSKQNCCNSLEIGLLVPTYTLLPKIKYPIHYSTTLTLLLFFFGCTCSMWKFLVQVSNLCHHRELSPFRDDTGSLTHCTTRELQLCLIFIS